MFLRAMAVCLILEGGNLRTALRDCDNVAVASPRQRKTAWENDTEGVDMVAVANALCGKTKPTDGVRR